MNASRENTYQGTNVEHLLANSVIVHPRAFEAMIRSANIPRNATFVDSRVIGAKKDKADVVFFFTEPIRTTADQELDTRIELRCSIKSFGKFGFNQMERGTVPEFCRRNNIDQEDEQFLNMIVRRKGEAQNPRRTPLVYPNEYPRVFQIIGSREVALNALLGNDKPEIFVLYSTERSRFHIYNISDLVEPHLRTQTNQVGITSKGNIAIGRYIVLQRKGSNGDRANDMQVKMYVNRFFDEVEPTCFYQL